MNPFLQFTREKFLTGRMDWGMLSTYLLKQFLNFTLSHISAALATWYQPLVWRVKPPVYAEYTKPEKLEDWKTEWLQDKKVWKTKTLKDKKIHPKCPTFLLKICKSLVAKSLTCPPPSSWWPPKPPSWTPNRSLGVSLKDKKTEKLKDQERV